MCDCLTIIKIPYVHTNFVLVPQVMSICNATQEMVQWIAYYSYKLGIAFTVRQTSFWPCSMGQTHCAHFLTFYNYFNQCMSFISQCHKAILIQKGPISVGWFYVSPPYPLISTKHPPSTPSLTSLKLILRCVQALLNP